MDSYQDFLERYSKITVIFSLLITLLLGLGLVNFKFTSELRAYFSDDNPQLLQFDALESDFNQQDSIMFIVLPDDGNVYTDSNLRAIDKLTQEAWSIPFSRRVMSLTNTPKTVPENDEIVSTPVVEGFGNLDGNALARIRAATITDPLFSAFVSKSAEAALVVVPLSMPKSDQRASNNVVDTANTIVDRLLTEYPHLSIHLMGTVLANYSIEQAVVQDISTLVPISGVLIFVILMILLRAFTGTVLTMCAIGLTALGTFGFFAWINVPFTPVSGTIPTMLTVIAVADCIHLLVTFYHELSIGKSKREAVRLALKINFKPMLITSLTTAIGLLCLNFSDSPPYRMLGNTVAFGAILAFTLSVVTIPAALYWLPIPKKFKAAQSLSENAGFVWMERLGKLFVGRSYLFLGVSAVVALLVSANIFQNKVDDQWDRYFDETFPLTESFFHMEKHFGGGHFLDFRAESGEAQGIYHPSYMHELEAFANWLRQQPEVGRVDSFSDRVKMVYQVLNDGDTTYYRVPDDREVLAQSVFLYEMSLPFGMSLEDQLNIDRSATRITAFLYSLSSEEMIALKKRANDWARNNSRFMKLGEGTGIDIVFAHMAQRNSYKLLTGTLVALLAISLILIFVFKSLKLGLLSLVPNIVPVLVAYGAWGIFFGKIDLAVSIVGAMCLGLVVDDTVHFLSKYQYARTVLGRDARGAVLYSFKTVGLAMVITSLILSLGFSSLALSHFIPTWNMGVLLATTITIALVFDFLMLPGLLTIIDSESEKNSNIDNQLFAQNRRVANQQSIVKYQSREAPSVLVVRKTESTID